MALTFPAADSAGARAFDYEVVVEMRCCDAQYVWRTKRVFSQGFQLAAAADVQPATCVFARDELPPANHGLAPVQGRTFRFVAYPVNAYGVKGAPIATDWLTREQLAAVGP